MPLALKDVRLALAEADLCAHQPIVYGADGIPTTIDPVEQSGYSLGGLQWDVGQDKALAGPFITSFQQWSLRARLMGGLTGWQS
jgi:hypothetical protein